MPLYGLLYDKFPFPFSSQSFISVGLDGGQGERKQQTSTEQAVNTKTVLSGFSFRCFKQTEAASQVVSPLSKNKNGASGFIEFDRAICNPLISFRFCPTDRECKDKPVFTPSSLVVKYGDPASATCTVCERDCKDVQFDVEKAIGKNDRNETAATVKWTVDRMTQWGTSTLCYYNDGGLEDHQCCTDLHVTVYRKSTCRQTRF